MNQRLPINLQGITKAKTEQSQTSERGENDIPSSRTFKTQQGRESLISLQIKTQRTDTSRNGFREDESSGSMKVNTSNFYKCKEQSQFSLCSWY